ncbi:two-component system, NtrC family, response regulator AtoC [Prosthecobacter debontii]|uniref:Two-component system, NtrC family, response regulator AtoC n=1 Tax=Prosthecobacter debontii TaxID=48467 RepID=A0A1T4YEG8_9BACT|nr:sigma-54 dependent transcriptional regulator [Prosthecobacter debontii]SKA99635.1 two-component system, NtrC family, response regulator AtoC [Prosthecobacter debontii]
MNRARILIADDTSASLSLLSHVLEPQGYEILAVSSGKDALKLAERAKPDLILLDVMMPGHDGYHVCRTLKAEDATRDIPVIFITSRNDTASILNGFRVGAVDYIVKPFQPEEVVTRVATHLKISGLTRELQQRNAELEAEVARRVEAEHSRDKAKQRLSTLVSREAQRWSLDGFVGESPHTKRLLADLERLRQFPKTSVLIMGESGTGKELIARAIHHHSSRAEAAFVPVNCVAVPGELLESLFFGHVKGAFTGATADRKGYFELADGGTLFLDEIGDMPAALQAKLLRVLEDGEVTPVGSTKSHHVDVRVLSATNADLSAKIMTGDFRQDLYYRLARYTVTTAPLRDRQEDMPLLAEHFLRIFSTEMGMSPPSLDASALSLLQSHSFPGNVRELKNAMERALILSGGKTIKREHLQLFDMAVPASSPTQAPTSASNRVTADSVPMDLEEAEHVLIQRALEQTGGNVTEAARLLNVNRSRIYRRMPATK